MATLESNNSRETPESKKDRTFESGNKKTESALNTLADDEIAKADQDIKGLGKTISKEDAKQFADESKKAKEDFLDKSKEILANGKLSPKEKEYRLAIELGRFEAKIKDLQGRINGKYGKSAEADRKKFADAADESEKNNKNFREKFDKAAEAEVAKAMQKSVEAAREAAEAGDAESYAAREKAPREMSEAMARA
jgi:hypothetical protein